MANRSGANWCRLVVAAALALVVTWWDVREVRATWDSIGASLVTPTTGRLTIVTCDADSKVKSRGGTTWTCHGPFVSDDGTVRIKSINMRIPAKEGPGSTEPAAVSGPGAERGWYPSPGAAFGRIFANAIAAFLGLLAWVYFWLTWVSGDRGRPRVPTPRRPRLARTQHRVRRRKPARLRRR